MIDDLATQRTEVASYIRDRTKNIVNAHNTLLWVRTTHSFSLKNPTANLNGGNLLSGLGLFSVLNYLAQLYYLLRGEDLFARETEAKALLRKELNKYKGLFIPRRDGSFNQTNAFVELIQDTKSVHNLGVADDDLPQTYSDIRHNLSHLLAPRYGNRIMAVISWVNDYGKVQSEIERENEPVFTQNAGIKECHIDRLARDVTHIAEWLASRVEAGEHDPHLAILLSWLDGHLQPRPSSSSPTGI